MPPLLAPEPDTPGRRRRGLSSQWSPSAEAADQAREQGDPVGHRGEVEVLGVAVVAVLRAPSAYDSLVPAMAVVETVVAGVLAARGDEARARMAACEQVARAADLLD